jgi:hypothetical protein
MIRKMIPAGNRLPECGHPSAPRQGASAASMSDEHREMENGPMPALMNALLGCRRPVSLQCPPACQPDDGQLNLPNRDHAELPSGGQRDYFAWLPPAAARP